MDELRSQVARAQGGDLEAFGGLVRRFQDVALRYANAILDDPDLAQDAVQESLVQAYVSLPRLREPAAFPAWFRAIVSNCSRRLIRGKHVAIVPLDEMLDVPSDAPTPEELFQQRDMAGRVLEAVRNLPEHERAVTRLFYFSGCSQSEIADILGVPISTVNNRLYASRRRLRRTLEERPQPSGVSPRRRTRVRLEEAGMAFTYEPSTRRLLREDAEVTIRRMTREDIPAMRRLDGEIAAGLDFSNAQLPPGAESGPGGPWANDEELREHFEIYESTGNITLLAEDASGKLIGFAELWAAHEPLPFGDSLDVGCIDYLWEYHHLGLETVLLEEAEKVARAAGLPAVDIGTNTSSGHYPTLRRFGMKSFYEYDRAWCKPGPGASKPSYRILPYTRGLPYGGVDLSGLLRISHWAPTSFDFAHEPGRAGLHELEVDGRRAIADLWRNWEPGLEVPSGCLELFAPSEALKSPELMSRILSAVAWIAAELGSEDIAFPIPCDMPLEPALITITRREFMFAWMRKELC